MKLVQEGLADHKLSKSAVQVRAGGLDAALAFYRDNPTPNLIILESDAEPPTLLQQIDQLAEACEAGTNVLVIGAANDVGLYRELVRRGVGDYLIKPVAPHQVMDAVTNILFDPKAPPMGRLVCVIGSRGGAGSSTIAHNLAWHLGHDFEDEVVLIDMDITFGTVGLAFNVETPQGVHTALADPERLDAQLLERFLARYDDYVQLLVAPASLEAEEKIYTGALERLLELVRRRSAFVVVDVPHRWAPWTQQVLLEADEVVIVSTLDLASLRDTKNLIDRLKAKRGENASIRLVLNHVGAFKRTELAAKEFESATELKATVAIAHDPVLFGTAANNGQMAIEVSAKHKAVEAIKQLSVTVSGRQPVVKKQSFLAKLLQLKVEPILGKALKGKAS